MNNRKVQLKKIYKTNKEKMFKQKHSKTTALMYMIAYRANDALIDAYCADYTRERKVGIV